MRSAEGLRRRWTELQSTGSADSNVPTRPGEWMPAARIILLLISIDFSLSGLYMGAEMGHGLGLAGALAATVIGSVIVAVLSIPTAIIGTATRLSTYMTVLRVFGRGGASLINLCFAAFLLGWYAVTADLLGSLLAATAGALTGSEWPRWAVSGVCSVGVVATTVFGLGGISRVANIGVPLLFALMVYLVTRSLNVTPLHSLMAQPASLAGVRSGISAVVGSMIVGVATLPDVMRYSRSRSGSITAAVVGNGAGLCLSMVMMLIPPIALHLQDPTRYLMLLGKPLLAVAVLLLATWPVNALNLYSAGLVAAAVLPRVGYGRLVLVLGAGGTLAAMAGVGAHLMAFLDILGFMAAPIASVYVTDFFVLRRRAEVPSAEQAADPTNLDALIATAAGCALGALSNYHPLPFTVSPAVDSFIAAALLYLGLERLRAGLGLDRAWRRAAPPVPSTEAAS